MAIFYIPHDKTWKGVGWCLEHSTERLKTCEYLKNKKRFEESIAIGTISIEESLKGAELTDELLDFKGISKKKWKNLKTHDYKLSIGYKKALSELNSLTNEQLKETQKIIDPNAPFKSKKELEKKLLNEKKFLDNLQTIREKCLYLDWDSSQNEWLWAGNFNKKNIESLAFFIFQESKKYLNNFHFKIESLVNVYRKKKIIAASTYPSYKEIREIHNYQSVGERNKLNKYVQQNKFKMALGIAAFQVLIS